MQQEHPHDENRWDPQQYHRFRNERSRPFFDLLGRVPDDNDENVVRVADLGCGTGELTSTLRTRWPAATILGVDNSAEMLTVAAQLPPHPSLQFVEADLATWQPEQPMDCIISNAALHWVPDHASLLSRLVSFLAAHGVLAVQIPANFDEPAHRLLAESIAQGPSASLLAQRAFFAQTPAWYADVLQSLSLDVDLWETTYYHLLTGPDAVLAWMKGTALRPVLTRLSTGDQAQFLSLYGAKLRTAYPAGVHGTLFPFRRLFFVARLG